MNTKPSNLGFSSHPCSKIVRQQPAKEKYFSYLMFLTTLEQVFMTWFFPQSRFFLLFHLCYTSGLSHSFSFHGFSYQRNSLAFFFFKHSRQGTCSWCRGSSPWRGWLFMGKGPELLLLPWLQPLLSFHWSPFFSNIQKWCM